MALANNYAEWVALVRDWLDIDDLSDAQIQTCLSLAQIRLNREMESYEQEKQFSYYQRPAAKVSRHLSDFDSSWFTTVGTTVTEVPVTMPASGRISGIYPSVYNTAWALIEDTSTADHYFYDDKNGLYYDQIIPAGSVITVSILAQLQSGARNLELTIGNNGGADGAFAALLPGGTIGSSGSYGTVTLIDASVESLGDGWFRVSIQVSGLPESLLEIGVRLTSAGNPFYPGDGVSGWLIQHHEIELQPLSNVDNYSLPTPFNILEYIPDFNKIRLVVPGANMLPMDVLALNEFVKATSISNLGGMPASNQSSGFYNIDANMLNMLPAPTAGNYPEIYYYFQVPPISPTVDSNVFTQYYSDAMLWAACIEASMFIVEDERAATYHNKYQAALEVANNKPKRVKMGSTPLKRNITMYAGNR